MGQAMKKQQVDPLQKKFHFVQEHVGTSERLTSHGGAALPQRHFVTKKDAGKFKQHDFVPMTPGGLFREYLKDNPDAQGTLNASLIPRSTPFMLLGLVYVTWKGVF